MQYNPSFSDLKSSRVYDEPNIDSPKKKVMKTQRISNGSSFEMSEDQKNSENNENLSSSKVIEIDEINPSFESKNSNSSRDSVKENSRSFTRSKNRHSKIPTEEAKFEEVPSSEDSGKPKFSKPDIITQEKGNIFFKISH